MVIRVGPVKVGSVGLKDLSVGNASQREGKQEEEEDTKPFQEGPSPWECR